MKKIFLLIMSVAFMAAGCTSKEQDEKIKAYWAEQQMKIAMKGSETSMKALSNPAAANIVGKISSFGGAIGGSGFAKKDMTPEEKAEYEKLLKEMQEDTDFQVPQAAAAAAETALAKPKKAVVAASKPIEASLFLSPTCPWCKKLKSEGFTQKFQRKYAGRVNLTEYMLNTSENNNRYNRALKKHRLQGGVPLLIIGNTPIRGYSEEMMKIASEAAEKELKKHPVITAESIEENKGPAILEVFMEDENLPGPASDEDKEQMKKLILSLQEFNGEMIQSMEITFGSSVKKQAMTIAANTEKKLKAAAGKSKDFSSFYTQYEKISKQNQDEMNKLMRQNTDKIR